MTRFFAAFLLFTAFGCATNTMRANQQRESKRQEQAAREARLNDEIARQRVEIELLRQDMRANWEWYTFTHPRKWWVN